MTDKKRFRVFATSRIGDPAEATQARGQSDFVLLIADHSAWWTFAGDKIVLASATTSVKYSRRDSPISGRFSRDEPS
jgi:hypothetical protein